MYNKVTQVNVQTHKVLKERRNEQRATKEKLQLSSKGLWPLILYALSKSYSKDNVYRESERVQESYFKSVKCQK